MAVSTEWVEVGTVADFVDGSRAIVRVGDREVFVVRSGDDFYAYENRCLHQGGPVGEGMMIGKVEAELGSNGELIGERFSEDEIHIVCPWHGWEYDIRSGRCAADRSMGLRQHEVEIRGVHVYVR